LFLLIKSHGWNSSARFPKEQRSFKLSIILSDFIPNDRSYYYYEGSLTTPSCAQVVQWFYCMRNPMRVPSDIRLYDWMYYVPWLMMMRERK